MEGLGRDGGVREGGGVREEGVREGQREVREGWRG